LRARVFKIFFEAWESLHLVWNDGVANLRHDVVQCLRAHDEREILAPTVRDYESFRQLGCTLPIEIMYLWDADLCVDKRAELESTSGSYH
jgi:hypothetical protein